jgi:hypothetical protein
MSSTHGGRSVSFQWHFENDLLTITNEKGRTHEYSLAEIVRTLRWLEDEFGEGWFPLINNVEKLGKGTEQKSLSVAILRQAPGDITHAQGASYLGVVLEEAEILKWNGAKRGIMWRLTDRTFKKEGIKRAFLIH